MAVSYTDTSSSALCSGDPERQVHAYTDKDLESTRLLAADIPSTETHEPLVTIPRSNTAYLDGLRGLAALFVFIHHFISAFTHDQVHGFGEDGHYHFVGLPFIRVLWSGGDAGVATFFILSGYVLSVGTLRKLKAEKTRDVRRGLLSAVVRRPIRLYFPPLAVSLIVALLLQIPGLMLDDNFSKPLPSLAAQLRDWGWASYYYFSIFRNHVPGGYFYNSVVWTLPIELKGSLLVYGVLAVLSLGMTGAGYKVPLMMAVFIFASAAIMLQMGWKWSMAEFLLGMVVAIMDVWPLEMQITARGTDTVELIEKVQPPREVSRVLQKLVKAASIGTQKPIRRATMLLARLIPRSLVDLLSSSPQQTRPVRSDRHQSTVVATTSFFIGWYLLSQPTSPGHVEISLNTPGWGWLTRVTPKAYEFEYFRYWNAWGALLLVWSLLRLPWLQRFFLTRPLQFLGHISFMLYVIHFPYFRTLPGRLVSLFGGVTSDTVRGSFWDKTLAFPDIGPPGLSSRFVLCLSIVLPLAMIIANCAVVVIDKPSVEIGRRLTEFIGLDQQRTKKHDDVNGISLPM